MSNPLPQTTSVPLQDDSSFLFRLLGALLLLSIAAIHYLDLGGKLAEVPYLGFMYMALIVGSLLSAVLLFVRPRAGWTLGGALALATVIGYCVNRTVGLPNAMDDIGNWSEPLGVASLVVEGAMVFLSAAMLRLRHLSAPGRRS